MKYFKYKLKDISQIMNGGTPSTKNTDYWNGDIPWITPKDLSGYTSKFIYKGERDISMEGLNNSSAQLLPQNTILFSSRAPIGYVVIAGTQVTTNQGFKNIICKSDKADFNYMYYWFKKNSSNIAKNAIGSTFAEISKSEMENLEISLPPLPEQKRIANILSSFDDKIEQLKKENNILEDIAQTIFKEWFIKYNFPDKDGKPYKDNGGKMVESELGLIPEGWRVGKLGEITEIIMGQSPKGESYNTAGDGIPLLNGALELTRENILNNKFTTQPTKISKVGDILFCIRATIGNIHFSDKGYCLGRGVASLRTTEDMQYYIYFLLHNIINTISISAEGSVIKGLTKDIIYNYPNIYNKETANLYNAHIKPLIISTQNNDKMINILDKCKSNLIKTLIK